ncbi:MAG: PLxRFG domain-containing protein, partial [Gammaproteobacteria bacterium]|nr:PLxRFG domain-containing protein [Gammaproteobacteria bacterium]
DRLGGFKEARYKNEKKARIVDVAFDDMLTDFVLDDALTYGIDGVKPAVEKLVKGYSQENVDEYSKRVEEARAEYRDRVEGIKKAIDNPKTLEEYQTFIEYKGADALTAEQRRELDRLQTEKAVPKVEEKPIEFVLHETQHTKRGHDLFVVQTSERVDRPIFEILRDKAKDLGGRYSGYAKNGAIPGYTFTDKGTAERFMQGESLEAVESEQSEKLNRNLSKLDEVATRVEQQGNEKLSADRKVNTARRAQMAASAEADAQGKIALAQTAKRITQAAREEQLVHLTKVSALSQIEMLESLLKRAQYQRQRSTNSYKEGEPVTVEDIDHVRMPVVSLSVDTLHSLANTLDGMYGGKGSAAQLRARVKRASDLSGNYQFNLRPGSTDRKLAERIIKKLNAMGDKYSGWQIRDPMEDIKRLERMGITAPPQLREVLREYFQYRGDAPKADPIKQAERELVGRKIPGFFPTPAPVVERMLEEADIEPGMKVLEPSAGKGNIADALKEIGAEVEAIEPVGDLRSILEAKGHNVTGYDFMEFDGSYDRVVMNPPFENSQDIEHVRHAFDLLNPNGGRVVAIMSEGPFFRKDKKAAAFRDWLEDLDGTSEQLPDGSFKESNTGVNTRLVVIDKPSDTKAEPAGDQLVADSEGIQALIEQQNNDGAEHVEPDGTTEPVTEKVVIEAAADMVNSGNARDQKHARDLLIEAVDKRIALANADGRKGRKLGKDEERTSGGQILKTPDSFVTFDIPGDGTFKVGDSVIHLERFKKQVKKLFIPKGPSVPRPKAPTIATTIKDFVVDGEPMNAYELAKLAEKPLVYGRLPGSDRVELFADPKPSSKNGEKKSVVTAQGESIRTRTESQNDFYLVDTDTGTILALGNTRKAVSLKAQNRAEGSVNQQELEQLFVEQNSVDNPAYSRDADSEARPLEKAVIRRIIDGLLSKPSATLNIVPTLVDTFTDLPAEIQQDAEANGAEGKIKGVYHEDQVYLVADRMTSEEEVVETLFHELYGHYGSRLFFNQKGMKPAMTKLWGALGGYKGLLRVADQYGINLEPEVKARFEDRSLTVEERNAYIMDELLAQMMGKLTKKEYRIQKAIKEVVGRIKEWLRGFGKLDVLMGDKTDTDLIYLLRQIRDNVNSPNPDGPTGGLDQPSYLREATIQTGQDLYRGIAEAAKQKFKDRPTVKQVKEQVRKYGLGWLNGLQLEESYSHVFETEDGNNPMSELTRLVRQMKADKNKSMQDADRLQKRWANLEVDEALGELMLDATHYGLYPDKPFKDQPKVEVLKGQVQKAVGDQKTALQTELADLLKRHGELNKRWVNLPSEAKGIYWEVETMYQKHWEQVFNAIEARLMASISDQKMRKAKVDALRLAFEQQMEGPYFPLKRFGDYLIVATREVDGEQVRTVEAFEKIWDRDHRQKDLAADGWSVFAPTAKEFLGKDQPPPEGFMSDVFDTLDEHGVKDDDLMDALNQLYLRTLPEASSRKAGIHRKNVAGFSGDARRAFAHSMAQGSHHLARLRYAHTMDSELHRMEDMLEPREWVVYIGDKQNNMEEGRYETEREANQARLKMAQALKAAGGEPRLFIRKEENKNAVSTNDLNLSRQVLNEMQKRFDLLVNPTGSPVTEFLGGLNFAMYLGFSPAAALVNLSQTPMVALPMLGAQYGWKKASSTLGYFSKAYLGDRIGTFGDLNEATVKRIKSHVGENKISLLNTEGLTRNQRLALLEWLDEGTTDLTQSHDLSMTAQSPTATGDRIGDR